MSFVPYPHQRQVADLLLAGTNVILQAPTGSGKTRAALLPFLESVHPDSDAKGKLPPKCIYAVPMRILAKQFHVEYEKILHEYGSRIARPLKVTIQTGDQQEDREFVGDLIFATIDQVLSSFLIAPYSLSRRRANLNAGAIASSYLVFDEFHLFDPHTTLPTTLHMLQMLKGVTPFLLMTATFSHEMLSGLAEQLDAVVVGGAEQEMQSFLSLPSQQKERLYHTVDDVMDVNSIIEHHNGRTLVICNQVGRAQAIYEQLLMAAPSVEVKLLHSRFLPDDRREREDYVRTVFSQNAARTNTIVVSTQAIEVGVDISGTVLHTELAPANAIIQRAGRCARYQGERGEIFIYRRALKHTKEGVERIDLTEQTTPYQGQQSVIAQTWKAFSVRSGQRYTYSDEQVVISASHGAQDQQTIQELAQSDRNHRNKMYAVMRGDPGNDARNLIRQVIAQPIVIHCDPDVVKQDPFAYPSFSLHPGTAQQAVAHWLDQRDSEWDIAIICENPDASAFEDAAQSNDDRYIALPLNQARDAWMASLLVVHPRLATYRTDVGFVAEHGGDWQAEKATKSQAGEAARPIAYRLETYAEHIRLVYAAFQEFWPEVAWTAAALEKQARWEPGILYQAAELTVLLHDVGKLSTGWQNWVHTYQRRLVEAGVTSANSTQPDEAYAHTDFNSYDARYQSTQSDMGRRPWHAVEGALAVVPVLKAVLGSETLAKIVFSAIAHHHAPHSDTYQPMRLVNFAPAQIRKTLRPEMTLPLDQLWGLQQALQPGLNTHQVIQEPNENTAFAAYLLLVRVLRRADSTGTERGSTGYYG